MAAGGHTVTMEHRVNETNKKVGFSLFGNKINYSEIRILISIS